MGRLGITYQDVASAAHQIKGQGKNVTIENVRALLGTGSIGTINNHLRKWKSAQDSSQKISSKENLPEELVSLIKGLWESVLTQSAEQFTPIENGLRSDISELKSELEKYKSNNNRWQKMFNQWQQEKSQLANEKLTLEQALDFAQKENSSLHAKQDALFQQLNEKQQRIDELHRLHKQAQDNLEHYRESAREQRLLEQQQYEQQKQQSQMEIKTLNEQLMVHREKISAQHQQFQLLQQRSASFEEDYKTAQTSLEQTIAELKTSEKLNNEYLQSSQHWQKQYELIQDKFEHKNVEFISIQSDLKTLVRQLDDTKQLLIDMQNQNKLLAREKWELVQEKAQVEGQLKQMQVMLTE